MKKNWQIKLILILVILSAALYIAHYFIFKDARHIFIYMLGDIAFIPVEVLFVTLVIHQVLSVREKRAMLKKLNMVVGAFYSEVGASLLKAFLPFDINAVKMRQYFLVTKNWTQKEFSDVRRQVKLQPYTIDIKKGNLIWLRDFLVEKREFLLRLLENPNLLEHEAFTELLLALFHLTEELLNRPGFTGLPESDYEHLANDIRRVYNLLALEWLSYMEHLSVTYPYLFSLAMRTNPFDMDSSVIVK